MSGAARPTPPVATEVRGGRPDRSRGEFVLVAALVLLSVGLHVTYVLQSRASPLFDSPQMDALFHVEWARALVAGEHLQDGPFFRAPLYPWFLAGVFRLFGDDLLGARLVQSALAGLTTLLVYGVGRRAFGRAAATVAALLHATYWVTIFYDGELLLEVLATPLYLGGLWLTLGLVERPSRRAALVAGVVWGLSAICRPNVLLFLPAAIAWVAWTVRRGGARRPLGAALALGLGGLLPILPITAYNALQGDRVLIASQAGVNLWIGNNPQSDGHTAVVPGTRPDWWGGYEDAIAQAEAAEGRDLRPSEVSRHYTRRALQWAGSHPAAWGRLMLWKLRLFWMDLELGNNEEPRFLARRFSPLMRWLPLGFAQLAALAAIGLLLDRGGAGRRFPLWGFLAAYTLSVVLFFVNARFRLPVLPVLMVYAGHGAVVCWELARGRRWPALGGRLLLAGAVLLGTTRVPALLVEETEANGLLRLGQAQARAGRNERALELYDEADAVWQRYAAERPAPASSRRSGFAAAVARAVHDAALELGRASFDAGDYRTAAEHFARALQSSPRSFEAAFSLAKSRAALGDDDGARAAFERALSGREPADPRYLLEAYGEAVRLQVGDGELEQAIATCERMVGRFPDDPRAAELLRRLRSGAGE